MINKFRIMMAFSAVSLSCAALPAFAADRALHVTVPFAFTAGRTNLPAGEYTVTESHPSVLTIRGDKKAVFILTAPGDFPKEPGSAALFLETKDGYRLKGIRTPGRPSSLIPDTSNCER